MYFLCPRHRQMLCAQPQQALMDLWLDWMNQAALCCAMDEPGRAVSFSGCAYEIMAELAPRPRVHRKTVVTKLTLSAIYLSRLLTTAGHGDRAAMTLSAAFQRLGLTLAEPALVDWSRECMATLMDSGRQDGFWARYLNLPLPGSRDETVVQTRH